MDCDGVGGGYDLEQLRLARAQLHIPLVASGGALTANHFLEVFHKADVDAGLAAGAFHRGDLTIPALKSELCQHGVEVRL